MAGGTTNSNKGPVILSMWHHAPTGMGESIHSLLQMEPAAVKGYEESKDFSIALTLDTNGVSNSDLDVIPSC